MADCKFSLQELKELMEKFAETGLGELCLKEEGSELKLKAKPPAAAAPMVSSGECTLTVAPAQAAPEKQCAAGCAVKAPIVGTFYASPSPDKPPYVKVGSPVKKGDVLFVIESMKLMNEITSEYDGEVAEILVEDAQGVEYNQPVMLIR